MKFAGMGGLSQADADDRYVLKIGDTMTGALTINAASGFTGETLKVQLNGADRFKVNHLGNVTLGGADSSTQLQLDGSDRSGTLTLSAFGNGLAAVGALDVRGNSAVLRFVDGTVSTRYGTLQGLATDHLGAVGLSGPQQLSVMRQFTDISNYRGATLRTGSDYVELAADALGAGAGNVHVQLTPAGTGMVKIPAAGMLIGLGVIADAGSGQLSLGSGEHYAAASGFFARGHLRISTSGYGAGNHVVLFPNNGASNILEQRDAANGQEYRLFGTYTDDSNRRHLTLRASTGGVFEIKPEGAGTGASGNVLHISGLPTSNPGPGILWNNSGSVAIGT